MKLTSIMALLLIVMAGCGSGTTEDDTMTGGESTEKQVTELSFSAINTDQAPENVQKWIEDNRSSSQKKVFNVNGKTYVVLMLGQKPTGGYDVEIEQIQHVKDAAKDSDKGGVNAVSYEITEPAKDSFTTQALTYPIAIAEMDGESDRPFQFITEVEPEKLADPDKANSDDINVQSSQVSNNSQITFIMPVALTGNGDILG